MEPRRQRSRPCLGSLGAEGAKDGARSASCTPPLSPAGKGLARPLSRKDSSAFLPSHSDPLRVSEFSLSLKKKSKGKRQRRDHRGFPQLSVGSRQELTAGRLAAGAGGSSPGPPPTLDAPSVTSFPLAVGGGGCAGGVMDGDSTRGELYSSPSFIDFLKKPLLSPQPPTCKAEDFPP